MPRTDAKCGCAMFRKPCSNSQLYFPSADVNWKIKSRTKILLLICQGSRDFQPMVTSIYEHN
jgi:hypothetical protein